MQKLYLSIPDPCYENWQSMTATEQGRFCKACAKEVIDFSMMTDTEVLNYFTTVPDEKVCGRTLPSQLERTISYAKEPKKRLFWYWNYIVMFLMFFSKSNNLKAQKNTKMAGNVQVVTAAQLNAIRTTNINSVLSGKAGEVLINPNRVVSGKVSDKNGNPVPFATIMIKGLRTGLSADANGAYTIRTYQTDTLVISGAGFKPVEVLVGTQLILNTVLQVGDFDLKEVVVLIAGGIRRRGCPGPIKKTDTKSIIKDTLKTLFNHPVNLIKSNNCTLMEIFPNPVKRGSSFALSLKLKERGIYNIQIVDALGRILLQKQTSIGSKEYMEQVQTDSRWSSGIYYMNVSNDQNKSIGKLSFIVK